MSTSSVCLDIVTCNSGVLPDWRWWPEAVANTCARIRSKKHTTTRRCKLNSHISTLLIAEGFGAARLQTLYGQMPTLGSNMLRKDKKQKSIWPDPRSPSNAPHPPPSFAPPVLSVFTRHSISSGDEDECE